MQINEKFYAFVANWQYGVKIIEVTNPYKPEIVNSIVTGGFAHRIITIEIR